MLRSGKKLPVKEETAAPKGNPIVTAFKAIHDEKEEIIACRIINDSNTIVTLESETETPALSAIMIRDQDKTALVKEKLLEDQLTATHRGDYYFTFPIKKGAHPVATAWDAKTNKLIRATKYKEHNLWRV